MELERSELPRHLLISAWVALWLMWAPGFDMEEEWMEFKTRYLCIDFVTKTYPLWVWQCSTDTMLNWWSALLKARSRDGDETIPPFCFLSLTLSYFLQLTTNVPSYLENHCLTSHMLFMCTRMYSDTYCTLWHTRAHSLPKTTAVWRASPGKVSLPTSLPLHFLLSVLLVSPWKTFYDVTF